MSIYSVDSQGGGFGPAIQFDTKGGNSAWIRRSQKVSELASQAVMS